MKEAYDIADKNSNSRKEKDRDRRNIKVSSGLQVGDRVLMKNVTPRGGPGKLRSFWEPNVYRILSLVGETGVVYQIQREDGKGRIKTIHRNLLLPCEHLQSPSALSNPAKKDSITKSKKVIDSVEKTNVPVPDDELFKSMKVTDSVEKTDEEIFKGFDPRDLQCVG